MNCVMVKVPFTRLFYLSLGIAGLFWPEAAQVLGVWVVLILILGKPKEIGNGRKK